MFVFFLFPPEVYSLVTAWKWKCEASTWRHCWVRQRCARSSGASWHITLLCRLDKEVPCPSSPHPFSPSLSFHFWRPGSHPFSLGFSLGRVSRWVTIYLLDGKSLRAEKSRRLGFGAPSHLEIQWCMKSHAAGTWTKDNPVLASSEFLENNSVWDREGNHKRDDQFSSLFFSIPFSLSFSF